jgi:hypothetical protein
MEYALGFGRRYVAFTPGMRNSHLVLRAEFAPADTWLMQWYVYVIGHGK